MTNYKNMTKAELIELLTRQAQEVTQAQAQAQEAQAQAEKAVKAQEELTGMTKDRIDYESKKFDDSITCMYNLPEYFTQDTVDFRTAHTDYLVQLGRRYIQEVIQNAGKAQEGRKARKAGAGRKASAGTQAGKAQDRTVNDCYRYLCATCKYELLESDKYITIKKEGKTQARVYVMRDNKLKFLIKEDVAKKAGLDYTTMKFNLPASIIVGRPEQIDAIVNAF